MDSNLIAGLQVWALPVILAICFHEAAHGYVAWRLGDDTAKRLGRVSINPLKHIDTFGTIILPFILFLAHSPFLFGYAKPVPVNFSRLRHPRSDMVWVALAGPAINIFLALISATLLHLFTLVELPHNAVIIENIINMIKVNVVLAVFNMFPLPPLDGGRILTGILPLKLAIPYAKLERYGLLILIFLLFILPIFGDSIGLNLDLFSEFMSIMVTAVMKMVLFVSGAWLDVGSWFK